MPLLLLGTFRAAICDQIISGLMTEDLPAPGCSGTAPPREPTNSAAIFSPVFSRIQTHPKFPLDFPGTIKKRICQAFTRLPHWQILVGNPGRAEVNADPLLVPHSALLFTSPSSWFTRERRGVRIPLPEWTDPVTATALWSHAPLGLCSGSTTTRLDVFKKVSSSRWSLRTFLLRQM